MSASAWRENWVQAEARRPSDRPRSAEAQRKANISSDAISASLCGQQDTPEPGCITAWLSDCSVEVERSGLGTSWCDMQDYKSIHRRSISQIRIETLPTRFRKDLIGIPAPPFCPVEDDSAMRHLWVPISLPKTNKGPGWVRPDPRDADLFHNDI